MFYCSSHDDESSEQIQTQVERRKQAEQEREDMQKRLEDVEKSARIARQGGSMDRRI